MTIYHNTGVDEPTIKSSLLSIKNDLKSTLRPGALSGNFASIFDLSIINKKYNEPMLLSATDGVGTKLQLALRYNAISTIGIDLVAMCANDIIAQGGQPYLFLDYYATSKFNQDDFTLVMQGIIDGCKIAQCSLVGGETAVMPHVYSDNDIDLAGFCIGFCDKQDVFHYSDIDQGDILIGLSSSGVHSNGYSLIHKIIDSADSNIIDALLQPTLIYKNLYGKNHLMKAICHITGGGFAENIGRVLPNGIGFKLDHIEFTDVFSWIQQESGMHYEDMLNTYNCGYGMVLIVSKSHCDIILNELNEYSPRILGKIT